MALTFPLRRGNPISLRTATSAATRLPGGDVSIMRCVGVVKRPQVQLQQGVPVWQCRLLIPQVGLSAHRGSTANLVMAKEHILLKCVGDPWHAFCTKQLYDGATVALVGTAVQRPRYVAIHSTYRYDTEIQIGSEGFITLVGSVEANLEP